MKKDLSHREYDFLVKQRVSWSQHAMIAYHKVVA
jgi:hypothetical protein